jgi:crossover junction endodeoxyribonuclease RusA
MSDRVHLCLPWPDAKLSPNARLHWAQRSKAVKRARGQAHALALTNITQLADKWEPFKQATTEDQIDIRITFEPPCRRRYDMDNLVARMKSTLDGIADALAVDDYIFRLERPVMADPYKPGGRVMVTLELRPRP